MTFPTPFLSTFLFWPVIDLGCCCTFIQPSGVERYLQKKNSPSPLTLKLSSACLKMQGLTNMTWTRGEEKCTFSSPEKTFTSWALALTCPQGQKEPLCHHWWVVNQLPSKMTWKFTKLSVNRKEGLRGLRAYYLFWLHSNLVVGGLLVNTNEFSTKMVWTLEFRRWRC